MTSTPVRDLKILLVEDDPGDQLLLRQALAGQPLTELTVCDTGTAALEYLHGTIPDLILLDLRLPGVDGFDVLKWIRQSDRHRDTPVVVLTGTESPEDRQRAYDLDATTFLTKPDHPDALVGAVRAINDFWIRSVIRHPRSRT